MPWDMLAKQLGAGFVVILVAGAPSAQPVAIVEEVEAVPGVAVFDTLDSGTRLDLGRAGRIGLGYLASCMRERIEGGIVTIAAAASVVEGGHVRRSAAECAGAIAVPAAAVGRGRGVVGPGIVLGEPGAAPRVMRRALPPSDRAAEATRPPSERRVDASAQPLIVHAVHDVQPLLVVNERQGTIEIRAAADDQLVQLVPVPARPGIIRTPAPLPPGLYRIVLGQRSVLVAVVPVPGPVDLLARIIAF